MCFDRLSPTTLALLLGWLGLLGQSKAQPCSLDPDFNPGLNTGGAVYAMALQTNGQIVIGGSFQSVGEFALLNVARLNSDGSPDPTFDPGVAADTGYVGAIAVQNDGKILVAGAFSSSSGTSSPNLTRLNPDGTVDLSFDLGFYTDGPINAVVAQADGTILIAGSFILVTSNQRVDIARLFSDGSVDLTFDACVSSSAGSGATGLAVLSDGRILVSGNIYFNDGRIQRSGIALLQANGNLVTTYASVQPALDTGTGYGVAVPSDGKALLVGNFAGYRTTRSPGIVRLTLTGAVDPLFDAGAGINAGPSVDPTAFAIALQSDAKVLIGGNFTTYNEQTQNGVARLNPDGSLDTSCNPGLGPDNSVSSFALQKDGRIVVGGKFSTFDGVPRHGIARLNPDHLPFRLGPPSFSVSAQIQLLFYGSTQAQYALQSSSNLLDWASITNFTATNSVMQLTAPASPAAVKRFYRAVTLP